MRSISRLLTIGVIGSLLLAGVVIGQVASWLLDDALRDYMAANLQNESRSVLRAIKRAPHGLELDSARIDPAYEQPLSGRYFVVTVEDKDWRSRSLWDEQLAPADQQALTTELVDGPDNQRLLWLRAQYTRFGQPITVLVATDYSPILQDINRISKLLLITWVVAIALLAVLQRYIMRRALQPLDAARAQVEQLRAGSCIALNEQVPEELAPLVREINRLLHDTQQQLDRSRTAVGDLSHSLKTPLAVLRNLIEREQIRNTPSLFEAFNTQLEEMRQRVTRELALARTAGSIRPENWFDVDADLPLLLETMRRAHQGNIEIEGQSLLQGRIPWEREDILEIFGNLLDNACKWGQSTVRYVVRRIDNELEIDVADDGPGIEEVDTQRVVRRGERLDASVSGHGLGLAIVADKVHAYRGTLAFEKNASGGLTVRVRLPWPHKED